MPVEMSLTWQRTLDNLHLDFIAFDTRYAGGEVGRVFFNETGHARGLWHWSMTASGEGLRRPRYDRGLANTEPEARAAVQGSWLEALGVAGQQPG